MHRDTQHADTRCGRRRCCLRAQALFERAAPRLPAPQSTSVLCPQFANLSTLRTNAKGLALIKSFEGFYASFYIDPVRLPLSSRRLA